MNTENTNKVSCQRLLAKTKQMKLNFGKVLTEKFSNSFVSVHKGKNALNELSKTNYGLTEIQQEQQSVHDTILNHFEERKRINNANQHATIDVKGFGVMTIAEAIILRDNILPMLTNQYKVMKMNIQSAKNAYNTLEVHWQARVDAANKIEDADVRAANISSLNKEKPVLVYDEEFFKDLEDTVLHLNSELNYLLSEKNAETLA